MTPRLANLPPVENLTPPAEGAVAALLDRAARMRASDLFFAANEEDVAVLVRHLGMVQPLARLPLDLGHRCVAHVKVMAGMDVAERRRPQDGRWVHDQEGMGRLDLRISVLPTLYGEDCAIRLLARHPTLPALEELGFLHRQCNDVTAMLDSPSGLILVSGATGVGKTTTLYACLRYLNNGWRKINTIEDPIEYDVEGVRQSQVNLKIALDFPELLRSVLRQAPDAIMIGEIRDPTTAATVVHAANSGHLVLATLHAPMASGAVQSMRAWGVNSYFLANSLLGVIAQRLVRTLCPECRTRHPLPAGAPLFAEVSPWLEPGEGQSLFAPRGCPACLETGYGGRTGIFEVMSASQALRRLIAEGHPAGAIREQAVREGTIELRQAALLKVARGQTTAEEVVRAVPSDSLSLEQ
jgi:general secretion pathway protein E